jgi:DNA-directed RNA polymerase specialized sigma24 family protein
MNGQAPDAAPVAWDDVQNLMADLKGLARSLLAREGNAGSVHSTQLANSALKKLIPRSKDWSEITWESREAFFRDAHFSMRRLLVDYARRRTRRAHVLVGGFESEAVAPLLKNGALDLDQLVVNASESVELAEAVAAALEELERKYPDRPLASVVQHRVFDGLGQGETAKLLQLSDRTVRTYEKLAYALLRKALRPYV